MTTTATADAPATRFDPIHSSDQMAALIASVTNEPLARVAQRLAKEFANPGSSVASDFHSRGIQPYVMSEQMTRFYSESDGFLYELAVWNRNTNKRFMCQQILQQISDHFARPVHLLSIGDGLGFDCLEFAKAGHRVTYFELPGKTEACARRIFQETASDIRVLTDPAELATACCDVLVCLDTLEHVPDPSEMVQQIAGYLRPGGLLFVHAPFYMIHPRYPTHLKSSRRFSGDLALYTRHGLRPVHGDLFWNPLLLAKADARGAFPAVDFYRRFRFSAGGWILTLGRYGLLPLTLVHWIRRRGNRWFDKSGTPGSSLVHSPSRREPLVPYPGTPGEG